MHWLFPLLVCTSIIPPLLFLFFGKLPAFRNSDLALFSLFIPTSYIYLLANWRKEKPAEKEKERWIVFFLKKFLTTGKSFYQKSNNANPNQKAEIKTTAHFMSQERAREIDLKIRDHFLENKPYLQHSYSLRMLSSEIHIPLHHLSAFINKYHKMNFNDFINEYRILFCIDKLFKKEWKFKKLEAIAEDAGFNNRNTFTTAFKKATGLNPSEFLKYVKLGKFQKKQEPNNTPVNGEISKVNKLLNKLNEEMPDGRENR